MIDKMTYTLLALHGDGEPHSFFETSRLTSMRTREGDRLIWKVFKRKLLENGWIRRLYKSSFPHLDMYQLTDKGDDYFRHIQMRLSVDSDAAKHYKYYDRKRKAGRMGVDLTDAERITEEKAMASGNYQIPMLPDEFRD